MPSWEKKKEKQVTLEKYKEFHGIVLNSQDQIRRLIIFYFVWLLSCRPTLTKLTLRLVLASPQRSRLSSLPDPIVVL